MPDHTVTAVPLGLPQLRRDEDASVLTIDCAECTYQHTPTCDDCVVTFLVDREPTDAVVVDADEARAVRLLERAGMVPALRHVRQVS